ncbi:MAG: hypothetical protein WB630_21980 [Candidatus Acidiferrales bacterium]
MFFPARPLKELACLVAALATDADIHKRLARALDVRRTKLSDDAGEPTEFLAGVFAVATDAKIFVLIVVVTAKLPYCGAFFS